MVLFELKFSDIVLANELQVIWMKSISLRGVTCLADTKLPTVLRHILSLISVYEKGSFCSLKTFEALKNRWKNMKMKT